MVAAEWAAYVKGDTPIDVWQNKFRHLRRYLRGWARNQSGKYKQEKEKWQRIIDELDVKAETVPLSMSERETLKVANDRMCGLRRDEETKWAQRAKVKYIQEGGNNTKYFHLIANGKHRKKRIFQLEQDEGTIVGQENLKLYISEYYKQLFGDSDPSTFSLEEQMIHDIPQLSQEENDILTADFLVKEVYEAISQMELNKAPGPDGFPAEFYKTFWGVIRDDLMAMFDQLRQGNLPLYKLNFGVITLLPKKIM